VSYIRTRCSYAVNTADLRSYVLQNLVGMHGCPTFVHATRLLPLPPATLVSAPRLLSTSSTCVRTRCRTSLVHTAVLHLFMLRVCHHYHWLHLYALLVYRQHCQPAFIRVAEPHYYPLLSYIRMRCSSAVYIIDLRSYALQKLVGTHCCPTFVHAACMQSTLLTCVCTHCRTSLVHTAVLHSYTLRVCCHCRWLHLNVLHICRQHRWPVFVLIAEPRWYALLSYIPTCCASAAITAVYIRMHYSCAVAIADIRSHAYQNRTVTY